ncbi:unnamed protein product [Lymnaea stagnalis]|uniref:RNA-binding protein 48 n=1 Tax=Lymnaea stagnalis TaxID=6523 RepID=A0AAV2H8B4_LYMST
MTEIPNHHIKQNICATRTPYRDGKHAKAVKVYTVNNESCYLLIQGVPSVGAMQELNKLCGSFGQIDQFNALDDYPSQDKYTEVYLVKFKKIQSSRFAKRKLDDYSFFGGALHVCYAPEYESINETREKLQDRRRVIAAKIRQHEKVDHQKPAYSSLQNGSSSLEPGSSGMHNVQYNRISQCQITQSVTADRIRSCPAEFSFSTETQTQKNDVSHTLEQFPHPETFELPRPPKELANNERKQVSRCLKRPHYFLKTSPTQATSNLTPNPVNISAEHLYPNTIKLAKPNFAVSQGASDHNIGINFNKNQQALNISSHPSKIIVREFKSVKPAPRFVPRQAMKSVAIQSPAASSIKCVDKLDAEIRKNAFHLREPQGPAEVPHREISSVQQSVNETIKAIRNKISMVINKETNK